MDSVMYEMNAINEISAYLLAHKETIAVAESVTSGHLQAALSLAPKALQFYQGGITAYNIGQKCRLLDIEPVHGIEVSCVSEQVAQQMAVNVTQKFISHWGIGITGYAAPVPELGIDNLFMFYSIAYRGKIIHTKRLEAPDIDPQKVQLFYTNLVLKDFIYRVKYLSFK